MLIGQIERICMKEKYMTVSKFSAFEREMEA